MPHFPQDGPGPSGRVPFPRAGPRSHFVDSVPNPQRLAANFVRLGLAEIICRAASVVITLSLTRRLGDAGYGRVEFAFNVVFWLILIVRDGFETIVTRELARHPRLTRSLVNHVLGVKFAFAASIFFGLSAVGLVALTDRTDLFILQAYGLLLITTALGLDFVYRGTDRMGVVAVSLCVRTLIYSVGVGMCVHDVYRIVWVPLWLAFGEAIGIALVWLVYSRSYGMPRPVIGLRFLRVFLHRGRSICLIHLSQAVITSADLMVVGLMSTWAEVGHYGAPHRMVSALLAFGIIFQQVVFPTLARSWRRSSEAGRAILNLCVRALVTGFIPIAIGGTVLANSLVEFVLPAKFQHTGVLLAAGVWRVPVLSLAFLYQASLIATNREATGMRLLFRGAARLGAGDRTCPVGVGAAGGVDRGFAARTGTRGRRICESACRSPPSSDSSPLDRPAGRFGRDGARLPDPRADSRRRRGRRWSVRLSLRDGRYWWPRFRPPPERARGCTRRRDRPHQFIAARA